MKPLEKTPGGEDREEDCRRTLHCDVCNRDFKGSHQLKHHLQSASHRKVLRTTTDKCHYVMHLVGYTEEDKNRVARIIKNTFDIGLTDAFAKMDNMPSELCSLEGETKATNIAKNMAKH